ncbi:CRISPR system precrRNA processing endoribonuclease RAMP protein Cas6 [uncultured Fretibacterium sp.]|uniref:CRISPR system precrRNA processing endoribonuclease RAMP protein Cas6 n=1 Tax=uncultured Fretibacterium sp. TaxID=1678694 RepID=UPI00261C73FF|nr:CRISPR system precrRNA processing endoribonuclease RAMP protein Cas6 [uncultured Fretibacterium sp.]
MRSYILQLKSRDKNLLSASNGYLLFSLLCDLVRGSRLDPVFHPDAGDGKKAVSLGMMRPQGQNAFASEDFRLARGDVVRARVSFIHDEDGLCFESLLRPRAGTAVRLGTAFFVLDRLLCPGEDKLALGLSPAQLGSDGFGGPAIRFACRVQEERTPVLPAPSGADLRRAAPPMALFLDPAGWPGFEEVLPRIEVWSYRAESRAVRLRQDRIVRGFCGEAEFTLPGSGVPERTALSALVGLAFFTGVGYKTTQGMGEVWPFWKS